ncbi:Methyl jasmonate esterase 1 [Euphorbia peplus]|nr:Methyl jasmonate esterase 1 [Euphorbia peplus]
MEKQSGRHYVLVHGACHGAWCWYKVAALLKSSGNRVTCLDMAASGVNPKQVNDVHSFSDYVEPLMEYMRSLSPEDEKVILVGHSMGGFCLSVAMGRFPEKISAVVFATAFMLGPQLDYVTLQQEFNRQMGEHMESQYEFGNGPNNPPTSVLLGAEFLATFLYQLSPPEDLVLATLLTRPMALDGDFVATQNAVEVTKEKYESIPRVFIVCGQDKIITEDLQLWMIQKNPTDEIKFIPDSDHMVMFSKSNVLCSYLVDIGNKYL